MYECRSSLDLILEYPCQNGTCDAKEDQIVFLILEFENKHKTDNPQPDNEKDCELAPCYACLIFAKAENVCQRITHAECEKGKD
jgi:hypothetical protein